MMMDHHYHVIDSNEFMNGSSASKLNLVSTSNTDNNKRSDEDEPYTNPNLRNDLSQMNISHLSHNDE